MRGVGKAGDGELMVVTSSLAQGAATAGLCWRAWGSQDRATLASVVRGCRNSRRGRDRKDSDQAHRSVQAPPRGHSAVIGVLVGISVCFGCTTNIIIILLVSKRCDVFL